MIRSLLSLVGTAFLWSLHGFKGKIDDYEKSDTRNGLIGAVVILVIFALGIIFFREE